MKRVWVFFMAAAMVLSLCGCREKKEAYSREGVLLSQSLVMTEQMLHMAESMEEMSYPESMLELAACFDCFGEEPDKAWIAEVGNVGTKVNILHGQYLGTEYLACASSLTQSTMVQLPWELEDAVSVLLQFSAGDVTAYSLVVYDPVEDGVATVTAYAVFSDVAQMLIDGSFENAEVYNGEKIEKLCRDAEDVRLEAKTSREKATESYYREKALEIMKGVASTRKDPYIYTTSEETLNYCALWKDVAGKEPSEIKVWVMEDLDDLLEAQGGMFDSFSKGQIRCALGSTIPANFASAYGNAVVASCAVTGKIAKSVFLGVAPKNQKDFVLVELSFDQEATAIVAIYDSGYGFNQYSMVFVPGVLTNDMESLGFQQLN